MRLILSADHDLPLAADHQSVHHSTHDVAVIGRGEAMEEICIEAAVRLIDSSAQGQDGSAGKARAVKGTRDPNAR